MSARTLAVVMAVIIGVGLAGYALRLLLALHADAARWRAARRRMSERADGTLVIDLCSDGFDDPYEDAAMNELIDRVIVREVAR